MPEIHTDYCRYKNRFWYTLGTVAVERYEYIEKTYQMIRMNGGQTYYHGGIIANMDEDMRTVMEILISECSCYTPFKHFEIDINYKNKKGECVTATSR